MPTYKLIEDTSLRQVKRNVVLRLESKVSEDELKILARHIKNLDASHYDRTFIAYYLPNMEVGAGAWATTHYNPKLDVKILGLSKEAQSVLDNEIVDPERAVIGVWFDERPYVGARLTFFEKSNQLFVETKYKDGSESLKQLISSSDVNGQRFDEKDGNDFGEYWLLKPDGTLQIFDTDGLFLKYRNGK